MANRNNEHYQISRSRYLDQKNPKIPGREEGIIPPAYDRPLLAREFPGTGQTGVQTRGEKVRIDCSSCWSYLRFSWLNWNYIL
jgi:hypothetical protein